jgi:hypothetical protein
MDQNNLFTATVDWLAEVWLANGLALRSQTGETPGPTFQANALEGAGKAGAGVISYICGWDRIEAP